MHRRSLRSSAAVLVFALALAGCSSREPAEEAAADSAEAGEAGEAGEGTEAAAPAPASSTAETTAEASMTVEDIDRWQKGMAGELTAVRDAGKQLKAAKTGNDSLSAIMAANETSTREAGARAAGVSESRYGMIASTLSAVVRYMAPLDADMDVSKLPVEMRNAMTADREQSLARISPAYPPAVIDALRPRAAALRKQEMTLVGERLKAAGMVP